MVFSFIFKNKNFIDMIHYFIMGASIHHTINNKKYSYIPFIILFPTLYVGYIAYENRELFIKIYAEHINALLKLKQNYFILEERRIDLEEMKIKKNKIF